MIEKHFPIWSFPGRPPPIPATVHLSRDSAGVSLVHPIMRESETLDKICCQGAIPQHQRR